MNNGRAGYELETKIEECTRVRDYPQGGGELWEKGEASGGTRVKSTRNGKRGVRE